MALKSVLAELEQADRILIAGAPTYHPFVEWLYVYGYENLIVCNAEFDGDFTWGPIEFVDRDPTDTAFESESVDAIVALSLIEEDIDVRSLLSECHRLLSPGGSLIVSTDYWSDPEEIDDRWLRHGGGERELPAGEREEWTIHDERGIRAFLDEADDIGFDVPDDVDYTTKEAAVEYKPTAEHDAEQFTFIFLELSRGRPRNVR